VLDCARGAWKLFDGNTLHATEPFEGERFSFILFTPDAYNVLLPSIRDEARRLGFTAAASDGADEEYFAQFRDLGKVHAPLPPSPVLRCNPCDRTPGATCWPFSPSSSVAATPRVPLSRQVDERQFDDLMAARSAAAPPPGGPGSIAVECNGYAAGRGSGWVSFQGPTTAGKATSGGGGVGGKPPLVSTGEWDRAPGDGAPAGVEVVRFAKNKTGIHVVELEALLEPSPRASAGGSAAVAFRLASAQTFNLYKDTEKESARWAKWVERLPPGRVVAVCITDTAMAKTRPLGESVYAGLRSLGALPSLTLIGYREPFAFVGAKGGFARNAAGGGAALAAQDAKKQSKTLLRIEAQLEAVGGAAGGATAGGGAPKKRKGDGGGGGGGGDSPLLLRLGASAVGEVKLLEALKTGKAVAGEASSFGASAALVDPAAATAAAPPPTPAPKRAKSAGKPKAAKTAKTGAS